MLERRALLQLTAAVATTALWHPPKSVAAPEGRSVPKNFVDAQTIWAKLHGDLSGRTVYFTTIGDVWGFKPQADDLTAEEFAKRAYGYAGVGCRKMMRCRDGAIVIRQKSWNFYRNPETEELTDKIPNRWTGVVDSAPPMSGPVSQQVLMPNAPEGKPDPNHMRIQRLGSRSFISTSNFIRFQSGGISWFKLEGNLDSYDCATADLENPALTHIPNSYSQNLIAEWQTWTHMHGQPGHILFKGNGLPLFDPAGIPDDLMRAIDKFFPGQMAEVRAWT